VDRKYDSKEKFLTIVAARIQYIIQQKLRGPFIPSSLFASGDALAKLQKTNPGQWREAVLNDGHYFGTVANPYLVSEYQDVTPMVEACSKRNILFFRGLDKQCSENPDAIERLKAEATFDFNKECPNLKAGEVKTMTVISQILRDGFVFLIGSKDDVSNSKYCNCRKFNNYVSAKRGSLRGAISSAKKQKKPFDALETDLQKLEVFGKYVKDQLATATANCVADKKAIDVSTNVEKKKRAKEFDTDRKTYDKARKVIVDDFNLKIQVGLKTAYTGSTWVPPTEKEWKEMKAREAATAKAIADAAKAAKRLIGRLVE